MLAAPAARRSTVHHAHRRRRLCAAARHETLLSSPNVGEKRRKMFCVGKVPEVQHTATQKRACARDRREGGGGLTRTTLCATARWEGGGGSSLRSQGEYVLAYEQMEHNGMATGRESWLVRDGTSVFFYHSTRGHSEGGFISVPFFFFFFPLFVANERLFLLSLLFPSFSFAVFCCCFLCIGKRERRVERT